MTEQDLVSAIQTRREDGVARITLNRPARLNAFAGCMRDRFADAIEAAASDTAVRVIVITGAGRAFSAGADVDAMEELLARDDQGTFIAQVRAGMRVARAIMYAPKPVVAGVNGVAAGAGASLAAAADLRIASDRASVGFTFSRIGLHPDWGASYSLPRLVGRGRAMELFLSGRIIGAEEGVRLGFFDEIVPSDAFAGRLTQVAGELSAKAPIALERAKRSLTRPEELEPALAAELDAQIQCFRSEDVREGIAAFREKRAASFQGR